MFFDNNQNNKKMEDIFSLETFIESLSWEEKYFLLLDKSERTDKLKKEFHDCVMYRIIDRGGNRIGARRAFVYALEFDLNIDVPMIYGIDRSDPKVQDFIADYIKIGGNKNLKCLVGYGSRKRENQKLDTIIIQELMEVNSGNRAVDVQRKRVLKNIEDWFIILIFFYFML